MMSFIVTSGYVKQRIGGRQESVITTSSKNTESSMPKVGTLDFALQLFLIAFTIIYMYKSVIFIKIVFHIIAKRQIDTLSLLFLTN